jgi:YD repeat-containing protein
MGITTNGVRHDILENNRGHDYRYDKLDRLIEQTATANGRSGVMGSDTILAL